MNPRLENGEYRCRIAADLTIDVESRTDDGIWQSRSVKFTLTESLPSSDYVADAMDRLKRIVVEGVTRSAEQKAALVEAEAAVAEEAFA